jgi:hypothetical protein
MLDPHMCLLQYVDNLLLSGIIGKRWSTQPLAL